MDGILRNSYNCVVVAFLWFGMAMFCKCDILHERSCCFIYAFLQRCIWHMSQLFYDVYRLLLVPLLLQYLMTLYMHDLIKAVYSRKKNLLLYRNTPSNMTNKINNAKSKLIIVSKEYILEVIVGTPKCVSYVQIYQIFFFFDQSIDLSI